VFAAIGGEDYELLAAMPESFTPEAHRFAVDFGIPLTKIGVVNDGPVRFGLDGEDIEVQGYSHFQ
jgi:thiamine-monophosphate kinase